MLEARKMLTPFVDKNLMKLSLEELAVMYQQSPETKILATAFEKTFKMAIQISGKYTTIDKDDIASFYLEKLDYGLKTFSGTSKVSTYIYKLFSNRLATEVTNMNRQKRKCILEPIHDLIYIGVEDTYNLLEAVLPKNLTPKEYKLCILESKGYDKPTCAKILGVSRPTVGTIERRLKIKLKPLQCD